MTPDIWLALIRHALTTIGGILVARGTIDAAAAEAAVGALATLTGVAWSVADKRTR